jgi:DNA-binding transcriptional MerR regulator
MNTYKTAEIAHSIGIHANTVRLYEELGLIPRPERGRNGYRIFTDLHLEQMKFARTALEVEVLQNGLRKRAIEIIKTSAAGNFDKAIDLAERYLRQIKAEQSNAEEAIKIAEHLLAGEGIEKEGAGKRMAEVDASEGGIDMTRKQTAQCLGISMDTLRNWEMNGLLSVKRKRNGYRIYSEEDIRRLKIIRSLRCANYSLSSILRMLRAINGNPEVNIREVINTPSENEDIISVCDHLLTSLKFAENNAQSLLVHLKNMKRQFQ